MVMSYFGRVGERSSRASIAFISLAGTRTPSGYAPASRFTVGCRPLHRIRKAHCRTTFQPFSSTPFHFFSNADQHRSIGLYLLWYGGSYTQRTSNPDQSANCIIRFRNCVRWPEFFGPLSREITSRLMGPRLPCTWSHQSFSASTQASLVSRAPKVSSNAPVAIVRMPNGTSFAFAGGS